MDTTPAIRNGSVDGDGPLYAVVLAAGAGSRFGGGKLSAPFDGGRLVEAAIRAAKAAPVERVIVVVQPGGVMTTAEGVEPVVCEDWAEGMAASLRTGIAALPDDAAGAFVFLGDMPRVPVSMLGPLAAAVRGGAPAALPTFEGQDGHPVLFSAALFQRLMELKGDRGARSVIVALGDQVVRIPAPDDGVLIDVDRPEDLTRLQAAPAPPIPR